ncbi:helix-turn-helix domain-containing protein [Ruminococcaceae bacterium OttesenSCG-928-A11]|nr:helix-turn-helix domain-containing protein [Ruminococcaceae bacterium OttesenSCG-928-A11]
MQTISDRVKLTRLDWELNQVEFANRLGVTNAHISKIEKGKTTPSSALIKLICKEYKISERWLTTGEGPRDAEDVEPEVNQKMVLASEQLSRLLKIDGTVRPMAAELNYLFTTMISYKTDNEDELVEYLNLCHKILYHIATYLDYKKKVAETGQQQMFAYPDDVLGALERDIVEVDNFFSRDV